MLIDNFFIDKNDKIISNKKFEKISINSDYNFSIDYRKFGYDYFDNKESLRGYSGYNYDGRYEIPVKKIIKFFQLDKKRHIIADFGCAKGFILYEFYKLGFEIIGFEKSEYAYENSIKEIKNKIVLINNIKDLNKYDFNFFLTKDTLPHLETFDINLLFNIILNKNLNYSYFVIQSFSNDSYKNFFKSWDITHKTIMNNKDWMSFFNSFFGKHDNNYISFNNLF